MIKKFVTTAAVLSLALVAASCSHTENANTTANTNSGTDTAATTTAGPDNSDITVTNVNGVRTETRTFHNNPRIARVVVTTRDGKTTAKAYSPSGEESEMSAPEKALNATGEAIADSAGWVKDKSIDAFDKSKDVGKEVVDKSKDVGEKTVEGTQKVVDKSVSTAKTAGSKTKQGAETVVDKTKEGAKKTTNAVKKVIPH